MDVVVLNNILELVLGLVGMSGRLYSTSYLVSAVQLAWSASTKAMLAYDRTVLTMLPIFKFEHMQTKKQYCFYTATSIATRPIEKSQNYDLRLQCSYNSSTKASLVICFLANKLTVDDYYLSSENTI